MIIDRSHRIWAVTTGIATFLAGLAYYLTFYSGLIPGSLHESFGGSLLGLFFGMVSFLIFLFAALLGWRRKHPSWRIGRMQFWMKGHIWLTFLTVPLILFHCGFRFGGFQTSLLMGIYLAVMLSGVYGLLLQHVLPRMMIDRLPDEVVFEQIPFLRGQIVSRAQAIEKSLAEACHPPAPAETVQEPDPNADSAATSATATPEPAQTGTPPDILLRGTRESILPYLELDRGDRHALGNVQSTEDFFIQLRVQTHAHWHPQLEELKDLCVERRKLDLQTKLQHWLHGWILAHAPFSFILIILTVWHIGVALFAY
ncbi:MAG: hypothetical protein SFU85_00145 [Candidatus Methylacidiphilales bacterium]|nr:hypothetical protein [Candidatus Methylacidiphilales bacterium]